MPHIYYSFAFGDSPTHLRRLFATILQTASSLETATGVSEGNAKHKPLPLDTSLWIIKRLLPFVRTVIRAKQTLLHPIHRLPVELLTEIFLYIHKSNVGSINDPLLCHPKSGRPMIPSPTVFILGSVSCYWRKITQSIPTLISFVIVTSNHLPPWWRRSLTSDMIRRRGIDLLIHFGNPPSQLNNTMNDIKVTWIRSATIRRCDWASLRRFERGPLSRLEELTFTPPIGSSEPFHVPRCLSGTLHTLIVHECTPVFNCVFRKLRKLSITYTEDRFNQGSHWQRDWRTLTTLAPNLEEFSLLHRSAFLDIGSLNTTAKDVELDWITIRSLASLPPGVVKIPAERMRVRIDTDRLDVKGRKNRRNNGRSLIDDRWNDFFTTTGLGQMMQQLTICRYMNCDTWNYKLLQPFIGLRVLELEGKIGRSLIDHLSTEDSSGGVTSDAQDGARNKETQKIAVACPNLERLVIRNSDLDGGELMRVVSERNASEWVLKGKVRFLKHIEIWNCPGVLAETRRSLRLLRDQDM